MRALMKEVSRSIFVFQEGVVKREFTQSTIKTIKFK